MCVVLKLVEKQIVILFLELLSLANIITKTGRKTRKKKAASQWSQLARRLTSKFWLRESHNVIAENTED